MPGKINAIFPSKVLNTQSRIKITLETYWHRGKSECLVRDPGGGGLLHKKGGDACREISKEPLKGANLGVA